MISQYPRLIFLILTIFIFVLFKSSKSNVMADSIIANLDVQIKQGQTSPPTFVATVTNNNDKTISFLDYESPVDAIIMALGNVELTPHGASEPVPLSTIAAQRVWPPMLDFLVELAPGASTTQETEFKTRSVPMDKLGSRFTAHLKGRWMAVWDGPKSEITNKMMESISDGNGVRAFKGDYSSNKADFNTEA